MSSSRCPNCGVPLGNGSYYSQGMAITCEQCGFTGEAMSNNPLYKSIKPPEPEDRFSKELGITSLSSKLALLSLFAFILSVGASGLQNLTMASLIGFMMFSLLYGFMRIRGG